MDGANPDGTEGTSGSGRTSARLVSASGIHQVGRMFGISKNTRSLSARKARTGSSGINDGPRRQGGKRHGPPGKGSGIRRLWGRGQTLPGRKSSVRPAAPACGSSGAR